MSDRLDDLFRKSINEVPPAAPPPGQWERISRRRLAVPPGNKRSRGWFMALGVLLGLGLGIPFGGYLLNDECPEIAAILPVDRESSVVVVASAEEMGDAPTPASVPTIAPAAAPSPKEERGAGGALKTLSNPPRKIERPYPDTVKSRTSGFYKPDTPIKSQKPEVFPSSGSYPTIKKESVVEPGTNKKGRAIVLSTLKLPAEVSSGAAGFLQPALDRMHIATSLTPSAPALTAKPRSGKWEFGAHLTPWLSDNSKSVRVYNDMPNGSSATTFNFNGDPVDLYLTKFINPNLSRRLRIPVANFELARQFGNGFRLGLSLGWQPSHNDYIRNQSEYFNTQLLESEWAVYLSREEESLQLGLSAGYTFRRHKRLRPYLGFYLGSRFYEESSIKQRIFRRSDGTQDFEEIVASRKSSDFGDLYLFAQAGLQYQIHERFSIGLEVYPGIGLGGRWRF